MTFGLLAPVTHIDEAQTNRGLRYLMFDGAFSQVMGVLTGGAFLVALALALGAGTFTIGLLAAIGPLCQILQVPAIFLIDKLGRRKLLVVLSCYTGRLALMGVAALPFLVPDALRVPLLLVCLAVYFGAGAIAGCAWNSWMRDFVPEASMGSYFARRLAMATGVGAGLSLVAGFAVDALQSPGMPITGPLPETVVYAGLFVVGGVSGLIGTTFLARVPEPKMPEPDDSGLLRMLVRPLKEQNFRRLVTFMGLWNFAVNLAGPFFVVYMLTRVGLSMTMVIVLSVVSQFTTMAFLRIWGPLTDRLSNKSVLGLAGSLFVFNFLLWPFVTMPDRYWLSLPLLAVIHVLSGMSAAGVAISSGNIALKAAPKGAATAYLATNALVCGIAATLAPILAGTLATWFESQQLGLVLTYQTVGEAPSAVTQLPALQLQGLDFLFVLAFVAGIYALHRLVVIEEQGEVERDVVVTHFYAQTRRAVRDVSNIESLRMLTYFPFAALSKTVGKVRDLTDHITGNGDVPPADDPEPTGSD